MLCVWETRRKLNKYFVSELTFTETQPTEHFDEQCRITCVFTLSNSESWKQSDAALEKLSVTDCHFAATTTQPFET
jgi:hypothetical protein